jgi:hypothetical protein
MKKVVNEVEPNHQFIRGRDQAWLLLAQPKKWMTQSANSQGPPDREITVGYSQYRHRDSGDITKVHW